MYTISDELRDSILALCHDVLVVRSDDTDEDEVDKAEVAIPERAITIIRAVANLGPSPEPMQSCGEPEAKSKP